MRSLSFVGLISGALGIASLAYSAPISSCAASVGAPGFTCNIYETDSSGTPSETGSILTLPSQVVAGFLILLENATSSHTDPTQWSDIVQFIDGGGGVATSLRLFSDGSPSFPAAQALAGPNAFIVENQTGVGNDFLDSTQFVSTFTGGTATYNIFSDSPVNESEVPEPASVTLLGLGFVALIGFHREASSKFLRRLPL
jgi:hypothetical protein